MTVKSSQKCPCVHIWVNSKTTKKGQLTDFDLYSNFQLKCLNSRRVIIGYNACYSSPSYNVILLLL